MQPINKNESVHKPLNLKPQGEDITLLAFKKNPVI